MPWSFSYHLQFRANNYNADAAYAALDALSQTSVPSELPDAQPRIRQRFFIHQHEVEKPGYVTEPVDNYRLELHRPHRVVTIALPLGSDAELNAHHRERAQTYPTLYAYLPTGLITKLPYLINADFILTASREEPVGGEKGERTHWNTWMFNSIPDAVASAVSALVHCKTVNPILCDSERQRAIVRVAAKANAIPKTSEAILAKLRQLPCLRCTGQREWVEPANAVLAGRECTEPPEVEFPRFLNVVVSHLERAFEKQLRLLGVQDMDIAQWVGLAEDKSFWEFLVDEQLISVLSSLKNNPKLTASDRNQLRHHGFLPPEIAGAKLIAPEDAVLYTRDLVGRTPARPEHVRGSLRCFSLHSELHFFPLLT